jgi:hypothetical protein
MPADLFAGPASTERLNWTTRIRDSLLFPYRLRVVPGLARQAHSQSQIWIGIPDAISTGILPGKDANGKQMRAGIS